MAGNRKHVAFGPGFLVTAAFIGPGTITTCSLAGADFGYTLIYALVFAVVTTLVLQEMTGRLSLASGRDLSQSLRDLPKSPFLKGLLVVLTLSSITFGCAAYEAGNIIGGSLGLEISTSVSRRIWVVLISVSAIVLLGRKKYRLIEGFLIFLVCVMSLSFFATTIIVKPDIMAILKGLIPNFPKNSFFLTLALIGTTVVPYNLFLHSSAVKQKWKSGVHLKDVRRDLLVSIVLGGLISASIIITSSAAYFQKGIILATGEAMAQQLRPLFGSVANFLFGIGFFAAGMSSAVTAPYAAAFASSGILGWKGGQNSKYFKFVWLGVILIGFIVSLFHLNPIAVIVFAQVSNGLILPVASAFLLIVLNDTERMGDYANNWKQNVFGVLIILLVSFLGIWNILKLFFS
ncbi:MAG: Nramp family divalent metal transporter [Candidatus Aminicenantes bacterium]|nr:Nramp family divalent metal transporter [Candidatus Aminicenantes bacterium]